MSSEQHSVDKLIETVKATAAEIVFSESALQKFSTASPIDREYLSYVEGHGGLYVKFLAKLIKELAPKNVVELGNREGLSTLAIYEYLPSNASFITIDILEDVRYCPDEMFRDSRVQFLIGDVISADTIGQVPINIDFLFTDTVHYYQQLRDEFDVYQHLLADGALVAIDDIRLNDKGKFWEEIPYQKWDLTDICHDSGWGIFQYKQQEHLTDDERRIASFRAAAQIWERKHQALQAEFAHKQNRLLVSRIKRWIKSKPDLYKALVRIHNSLNH